VMLPETGALYRLWRDAREEWGVPTRQALSPDALRPWLGSLSIYERLSGGDDFRIRLEGTKLAAMSGEDWTGRLASERDRRFGTDLLACCVEVCRLRLPLFDSAVPIFPKSYRFGQRLLLPLSRDGEEATQVMLALFPVKLGLAERAEIRNRRVVLPG
jgi:hypothetical protein